MVSSQPKMDSIRDNYGAFCGLCEPSLLEMLRERVEDITQEWQRIEERLKNKIVSLKVKKNPFLYTSVALFSPFHSVIPLSCNRLQKKKTTQTHKKKPRQNKLMRRRTVVVVARIC
jgi:hypothetical protein